MLQIIACRCVQCPDERIIQDLIIDVAQVIEQAYQLQSRIGECAPWLYLGKAGGDVLVWRVVHLPQPSACAEILQRHFHGGIKLATLSI